jgi:protocatechuate 3,4-dioxygenase alpha subunit
MVEIWDGVGKRWGRSGTDSEGRFAFLVGKPEPRPGDAPRLDVIVFARGMLKHELTRIYFPDEAEANAADPVWSALDEDGRSTLVAEAEDGALRFDIRMQGPGHTLFFEH